MSVPGSIAYHRDLTPFEERLIEENRLLRDQVRAIQVRSIPDSDRPGWDVWRALMEDLRAEGRVRVAVRTSTWVTIDYEHATEETAHGDD